MLQQRVQHRINEIQQIFGLDSKILSEDEILNDKSMFAIYSERDEDVLEADDMISTIFDKAERLLLALQHDNRTEYDRIIQLKDGVRTACIKTEQGIFAYFTSGNLHRLYFHDGKTINENLGEILTKIEASPDNPKAAKFDPAKHNDSLKILYDRFKNELYKRNAEIAGSQITPEQKHFQSRLQNMYTLFNGNEYQLKKIDELFIILGKEIPDYAKSQLRRLRRENLSDDSLIEHYGKSLNLHEFYRFQEKEKESEKLIVRTICSEGFE